MALTELWKTAHKEIQDKHVQQVIGFAGDGKLRDGGAASKEFRDFLALVPSNFLSRYANDCLTDKFDNSGLALQDVINEVGTRLGFRVEQGRYRGTQGEIGFDGLWISPDENGLVVEVKTTDAYRIDLETVATYRRNLIADGRIKQTNCSILIIVGRTDTGDLEAQVRGSRHAWDIRLISIDGLLRLMHLKEELDDPKIMGKIRQVLTPQEFTKVDGIIDLVFSTTADVKKEQELTEVADEEEDEQHKTKFTPLNFRDACAIRVQKHLGQPLVKRSSAVYSSPDENLAVVCINSREYKNAKRSGHSGFWFAFHPHQRDLLQNHKQTFVALGCGSADTILLIPGKIFIKWLDRFHKTERDDRYYWHIRIHKDKEGYLLRVKKGADAVRLNEYLLKN
ncbi:MAG TPA: hypothetical protein VHY30_02675 [Verrucomicrobiae bacterium]|jgi:hypothetical protein|nr:hypothetical protein [Verrucomicrobiae bacterium]